MFSTESVWLHMRDGYRLLAPDREGRLALSDHSQTSRVLVHTQAASSYSACMGNGDTAHVLIHTHGGNLLYGVTVDGHRWKKFTLTRSNQEYRLRDPIIFADKAGVHILYIAEQDQSEALIHYQQNAAGSWNGNTLDTYSPQDWVRLLQMIAQRDDIYLFVLSGTHNKARIKRYSLVQEPGRWREVLTAPLPFTDFHVCRHEDELHMGWLSDGRVYADGTPLSWSSHCRIPCLNAGGNELSCTWLEPDGLQKMSLGTSGWQPAQPPDLKKEPALHIILENGYPVRSLQPPMQRQAILPQYPSVEPSAPTINRSDPHMQRMAAQTLMLFRQLSDRIDKLQTEMDTVRKTMIQLSGTSSTPVCIQCEQTEAEADPPQSTDTGQDAPSAQ